VQILATGHHAPQNVVSNSALEELGYDAEWIVQRTGIQQRHRAGDDEPTSHMAAAAARCCLENAGVAPSELDLILVATITPDNLTPSTACHVQRLLGATAPAMDVGAACAGFIYALVTGMQFVKTRCSQRVLVIGADKMTHTVAPDDRKTFPLFGDGAGAVLLGPGDEDQGFLSYTLGAEGDGHDLLCIPGGGTREPLTPQGLVDNRQFLHMDGRSVFKWAVRLLSDTVGDVLNHAEMSTDEIDLVCFHQANQRIIDSAINDLGIPAERVFNNLDRYGNTSAASIPLVLAEANEEGRLHSGQNILISGFGAGLAWGAGVMKW